MFVVRFFQQYALVFSISAGLIARHLILPEDSNGWLKFTVMALVTFAVFMLLYKRGVTGRREGPGLSVLEIVVFSLGYLLMLRVLHILALEYDCGSRTDTLAFDRCIDWRGILIIVSACIAAIVYALGLRAAIRARRNRPFQ